MIKKLSIYGLFGEINISIPFGDAGIKILISENGTGKTSVLKILYAVLSRKFYKLASITFDKIILSFHSKEDITIHKTDISNIFFDVNNMQNISDELKKIQNNLSENNFIILLDSARTYSLEKLKEISLMQYLFKIMPEFPKPYLVRLIKDNKIEIDDSLFQVDSKIAKNFTSDVLYLPTYRRIEEDLRMLGLDDTDLLKVDEIFRSGMQDVNDKIVIVLREAKDILIKRLAVEKQQEFFFDLTNALYEGEYSEAADFTNIKIAMGKICEEIENIGIESILDLFSTSKKENKKTKNEKREIREEMIFGIKKTYEHHQQKSELIDQFIKICNKYLIEKELIYDEKEESLYITKNDKHEKHSLNIMSSGEKQVVSLFSRIYFDLEKPGIVIIDEPENSLSIEWQKELLPDIYNTPNCKYLIATTHSPFIFSNDLNVHAVALKEYIGN